MEDTEVIIPEDLAAADLGEVDSEALGEVWAVEAVPVEAIK